RRGAFDPASRARSPGSEETHSREHLRHCEIAGRVPSRGARTPTEARFYWALSARVMKPVTIPRANPMVQAAMLLMYLLYCLPLNNMPVPGQPIRAILAELKRLVPWVW